MPRAWLPSLNCHASRCVRRPGVSLRFGYAHTHVARRILSTTNSFTPGTSDIRDAKPSLVEASVDVVNYFSYINRWILFSDLHVHERYSPHWRSSLNSVSQIATQYDAGCIFLVRGHMVFIDGLEYLEFVAYFTKFWRQPFHLRRLADMSCPGHMYIRHERRLPPAGRFLGCKRECFSSPSSAGGKRIARVEASHNQHHRKP